MGRFLKSLVKLNAMTVTEAAKALGISTSAVRQAIAAGKFDAIKRGSIYFIDAHSVATYRDHTRPRGPHKGRR